MDAHNKLHSNFQVEIIKSPVISSGMNIGKTNTVCFKLPKTEINQKQNFADVGSESFGKFNSNILDQNEKPQFFEKFSHSSSQKLQQMSPLSPQQLFFSRNNFLRTTHEPCHTIKNKQDVAIDQLFNQDKFRNTYNVFCDNIDGIDKYKLEKNIYPKKSLFIKTCDGSKKQSMASNITKYNQQKVEKMTNYSSLPFFVKDDGDSDFNSLSSTKISKKELLFENESCSKNSHGGMAFVIDFDFNPTLSSQNQAKSKYINETQNLYKKKQLQYSFAERFCNEKSKEKKFIDAIKVKPSLNNKCLKTMDNKKKKNLSAKSNSCLTSASPKLATDAYDNGNDSQAIIKKCTVYRTNLSLNEKKVDDIMENHADEKPRTKLKNFFKLNQTSKQNISSKSSVFDSSINNQNISDFLPTPINKNIHNAQLSESAVYLINRMFEDSRSYHDHFENSDQSFSPEIDYYANQSQKRVPSSCGSVSPCGGTRSTQSEHHSNNYSHSLSNSSTRLEYDDSFYSRSDSTRLSHRQSMTTIVQSSLDKQVDSAIDDDGDLIPDDISDTGTYTIEIDKNGRKLHRKSFSRSLSDNELKSCDLKSKNYFKGSYSSINSDIDYENSEFEKKKDLINEDKLEMARKQINELFDNYNKNQEKKMMDSPSNEKSINHATFTRSKRTNQSIISENKIENSVNSLKNKSFFPQTEHEKFSKKYERHTTNSLIETWKINNNSKPEKKVLPVSCSLSDKKNKKLFNLPKKCESRIPNISSKPPSVSHSAPSSPFISSKENRKSFFSKLKPNRFSKIQSNSISNDQFEYFEDSDEGSSIITRNRSGSMSSSSSCQLQSSLRYNRAFALRRARLGIDTCGAKITETKETEKLKPTSQKLKTSSTFKRSDGGRFSLRQVNVHSKPNDKIMTETLISSTKASQTNTNKFQFANSSFENLASKIPISSRVKKCVITKTPVSKLSQSDNEVNEVSQNWDSKTRDVTSSFFSKFGRSSLRCTPSNKNKIPWLQSLKPQTQNHCLNHNLQTQAPYFHSDKNSNILRKSDEKIDISSDDNQSSECNQSKQSVRSISSFQIGKRFFSTKPHQKAQFDKEFNCSRARSASANSKKITLDSNLMTHSATESLLSKHNTVNHDFQAESKQEEAVQSSPTISPGINSKIFSISPLDSLVISAINQLSSKLRTKMSSHLERERSKYKVGSESRSLIDEILPQVETSDSQTNLSKKNFNHENSNISRDLSNILKNLKKVEQIFDIVSMLSEQNSHSDFVFHNNTCCEAIKPNVTNASDSDSDGQPIMNPKQCSENQQIDVFNDAISQKQSMEPSASFSASTSTRSLNGFFIEI